MVFVRRFETLKERNLGDKEEPFSKSIGGYYHRGTSNSPESMDRFMRVQGQHPFHPSDPPLGTRNYDLGSLSRKQREWLLRRRLARQRENEIYLKSHPEIKAFIAILLRYLLRTQPKEKVQEAAGAFFNRPRYEIVADLAEYLRETGQPVPLSETFEGKDTKEEEEETTTSGDSSTFSSSFEKESIERDGMSHF